ncbi:MAG: YitT family protein [Ruminococcaceae bacterium]|nr:YitT family protein [Oscillospiraceae bacterium]
MEKLFGKIKAENIFFLTIAGLTNAFGITLFLTPVKLYDSGISGTSMLLAQITPEFMTLSVFLLLLNIPLFILGYKKQGRTFTVYSVYTVIIYSIGAWLITDILPIDVSFASPLAGTDLLLCALFGGLISGVGSGLTIRYGGAIDGIEVMAVIFAKKIGVTVGTFVMTYNVLLYVICGMVLNSWILPLYSIVTYGAGLKTIDFIVEGIDRSKAAMIITSKPDEVCEKLMSKFECGATKLSAKGGYSNEDKTVIYFIVDRFQISKMREIVHKIDEHAFITITEVADVFKSNMNS